LRCFGSTSNGPPITWHPRWQSRRHDWFALDPRNTVNSRNQMIQVSAIGHASFETPDLERMADYYQEVMGLALVARDGDTAFLASPLDHHSVVLKRGSSARCSKITLQVPSDTDFNDAAKFLTATGLVPRTSTDGEPSAPESVEFAGPDDIQIGLIRHRAPSETASETRGIGPRRLGHVAFNVDNVQRAVDFFVGILGFRVSDWMGDFFAFLRCGPDHHTINFLHGSKNKMHHIAFESRNWDHIKNACDLLGKRKIPLVWGPGRHGIGHNLFIYHLNPDAQIMELYAELDQMSDEASGAFDPRPWHEDNPQRPKVWQPGISTSNIWGIPTPQLFRE
jgi:catechol 2,3-dioxygenase-like lactoylglutathione lyase family enzyme